MGKITNRRHGIATVASLTAIAGFLAACDYSGTAPAPVYQKTGSPTAANAPAPPPPRPIWHETKVVTVTHGETVLGIARAYRVPEHELIEANHLKPPYMLWVGDRLILPDLGSPPPQLALAVPATPPMLPAPPRQMAAAPPATIAPAPAPPPAAAPRQLASVPPTTIVPAPVPPPAAAPPRQVAALPPVPPPAAPPRQLASVPPTTITPAPVPPPAAPPRQVAAPPAPVTIPPAPEARNASPEVVPLDVPPPKQVAAAAPAPAATPAPPPAPPAPPTTESGAPSVLAARNPAAALPLPGETPPPPVEVGGGRFPWPVNGRVLASYGSGAGGRNEGINIAAPSGTPVHAIEGGTVAYAGNEVKGYGNLVLVKHADGWISAYAHLADVTVKKGETVSTGQILGNVGNSGGVNEPQLHFELRRGQKPVDPREFLSPAPSAAAPGGSNAG